MHEGAEVIDKLGPCLGFGEDPRFRHGVPRS